MQALNRVHLNGLRAVEAVYRCGSLQRAADELGVSPSAVSQQINRTESQLGRAIFERTSGGLVANAFGQTMGARLSAGFRELAAAVALADDNAANMLVISVAPAFASRWLVPRLSRYQALYPNVSLRIDASVQIADLDRSDVDVAIRMGKGDWPNTNVELLLAQEIFPVCAPGVAAQIKTPADLAKFPMIADQNTMFSSESWLKNAGIENISMKSGPVFTDPVLCIEAAIAGQGIMLAWQLLAADALADGRLVDPFGSSAKSGLGYYLATPKNRRPSENVNGFKRWIFAEIQSTIDRMCPPR